MPSAPSLRIVAELPADTPGAIAVGVHEGRSPGPIAAAQLQSRGITWPLNGGFTGKSGEHELFAGPLGPTVIVGLGREVSTETYRRAAGAAVRLVRSDHATITIGFDTPAGLGDVAPDLLRAIAEGAQLGGYRYDDYRSSTRMKLRRIAIVGDKVGASKTLRRAKTAATVEAFARDLVNMAPAEKSPEGLAAAISAGMPASVSSEVWDEVRLASEGCGGLVGVGKGSSRPPRLLILRYRPEGAVADIGLVGKGITFDTGGLSLKRPNTYMIDMKMDMGGAAAVAAAIRGAAELGLPVSVTAYCALAENMPSASAQRPSDVLTIRNGTTVEVLNTDAEGRLVLADALSLAVEAAHDTIIDVATLTGAILVAVGDRATGLFTDDDGLSGELLGAGADSGEPIWRLPLWNDLRPALDSDVADLNNLGLGHQAGATMAGLFLREFTNGARWAHLDIAGAAWSKTDRDHISKQGTGAGSRTLLRWLETMTA